MITSSIHPTALRHGDVFALPVKVGVFDKAPPPTWCKVLDVDHLMTGVQVHYHRLDDADAQAASVVTIPRTESVVLRRPEGVKRIAFAGASGTGKTTRMNAVAEALGLPVCPVGSRSVAAALGYASPYDVDKAGARSDFQRKLFDDKATWEKDHENTGFVTDRTHYDNLAYTALHAATSVTDGYLASVVQASAIYTTIVFCPMSVFWNVGDDPARVKDRAYHEMFDILLYGLLQRYAQKGNGPGYVITSTRSDPQWLLTCMGWAKP